MKSDKRSRPFRFATLSALCMALLFLGLGPVASAVDLDAEYSFNIAPQSLATALVELSRQANVQVVSDTRHVSDIKSPGVSGRKSLKDGLRALLEGTKLSFRADSDVIAVGFFEQSSAVAAPDPTVANNDRASVSALQEVLVKGVRAEGTKGGATLLEVPQAVSVLSRDLLDAQGVQRLEQAVRYSAGITSSAVVDTRTEFINIRGFEQTRVGNYLDNLRLSYNSGGYSDWNIETYNLERVEILRGPSSVLYGQGSPGGVINSVSKRPTASPHRELMLGGGTYDRYQASFDVGGPMSAGDELLYRLVGVARDSGTQVNFVNDDRLFIAPSLTWKLGEKTRLTILTEYLQDRTSTAIGFLPPEGLVLPNPNGRIRSDFFVGERDFDRFNTDRFSIGYQLESAIGRWTLRQNARYGRQTLDYQALYGAGFEADLRTLNRGSIASDETVKSLVIDNQAQTRFAIGATEHTALVGVDYQWARFDVRSGFGGAPPIDIFSPVYGQSVTPPELGSGIDALQELDQIGVYVQDQMKLAEKWVVTAGLRGDWPTANITFRPDNFEVEQKDDAITGRIGLVYLSPSGFSPYVSYATSFLPTSGVDFNSNPFEPETAKQVEVGVKYQPPGARAFTTLSVFDLRREKYLTSDPDPEHIAIDPFAQVQQGAMRSRGLELEAKLNPIDGLDIVAAYTYLDATITEAVAGEGNFFGNVGDRIATIPEQSAALWGEYLIQDGVLKNLAVSAGVRYIGTTYNNENNNVTVPSVTLADAAVRYYWGNVSLALNASNVFDKDYVNACTATCYNGLRRTVLGTVRYRW